MFTEYKSSNPLTVLSTVFEPSAAVVVHYTGKSGFFAFVVSVDVDSTSPFTGLIEPQDIILLDTVTRSSLAGGRPFYIQPAAGVPFTLSLVGAGQFVEGRGYLVQMFIAAVQMRLLANGARLSVG